MLKIYDTFDLKDEGGIGCVISPKGSREVTVISLTHLKIHNRHPLFKEIRAYQKKRKKELKKRGSISGYTEITP